jgi:hypothetical protein
MTITITKTLLEKLEVTAPKFWREPGDGNVEYIAILDEKTVCCVYHSPSYSYVNNSEYWLKESNINRAATSWTEISEEEFFEAYQKAYESLNLNPIVNGGAFAD